MMKRERRVLIAKYARLHPSGRFPLKCVGSRSSRWDAAKVIFKSLADAEAFLRDSGLPGKAYECPASKHGHAHLSSINHFGGPDHAR